ncbi:MAG: hypothetical protein H6857_01790 [Rhodospirillales bacterium]|nr:hypothetical protein [Rhodospirillales bacterium]
MSFERGQASRGFQHGISRPSPDAEKARVEGLIGGMLTEMSCMLEDREYNGMPIKPGNEAMLDALKLSLSQSGLLEEAVRHCSTKPADCISGMDELVRSGLNDWLKGARGIAQAYSLNPDNISLPLAVNHPARTKDPTAQITRVEEVLKQSPFGWEPKSLLTNEEVSEILAQGMLDNLRRSAMSKSEAF